MKRAMITGMAAVLAAGGALAEPLPEPSTDYRTKGTMTGGMSVEYRHAKGKMRVDMRSREMPQPMVGYFDMKTRKGVMVMSMPGMPPMAVETGLDAEGGTGVAGGSGERIGSDRVAGESCDLWRIESKNADLKNAATIGCITRDGIMLRVEADVDGKRQTIFQVTEIDRSPQDAKQLTPPTNLKPMQIPAGMMPGRK